MVGAVALTAGCSGIAGIEENQSLTDKVDPLIGSGGHGHVFVGANVPFGMVQVGPTSITEGWDWCSGYHESDSTIIGFSHTHLSGTGCGDLLDITVMPVVGDDLTYDRGSIDSINSGLWSYADRNRQIVRPGYYSVPLTRYGILAEMTATSRVGFHRYSFPKGESQAVVIDLLDGGNWDRPMDIHMEATDSVSIQGWRHSRGWANNQKVYFTVQFSRPFEKFQLKDEDGLFGRADFRASEEPLLMKVALSAVSIEGAEANLKAELPGWDFDGTVAAADRRWNDELRKIKVKGASTEEEKIFYTSLYHTMVAPSEFSDVNGDYRGADGEVRNTGHTTYTTYSLWDTYRAAMPLLSITHPDRYADMINTMTDIAEEQGRLPVWHLWGCETDCMVGSPAIPVIADAIVKDIPGVNKEKAYKAMLTTAMDTIRGNGLRQKYGYIPFDLHKESVAYDMEYALADGAIAQAAIAMGDSTAYKYYTDRSHSYRNYFDPQSGLMRGKDSNGKWRTPFTPFNASHRDNDYCEGTAWQYTWLAPHDVKGLRDCFGSDEKMIAKLDSLFIVSSHLDGGDNVSPDVSGLIGQYAHGNEPGHHTAYLYTILGYPDKTADKVREILSTMYTVEADGICGNEDVGQMSAWYVLSALGLYEVEPGSGRYWFGYPLFNEAEITVPGGAFKIIAERENKEKGTHIKEAYLNGKALTERCITYADMMNGGELKLIMKD